MLSGAGETTCANTRCQSNAPLTTLELPFAYEEHGEQKSALVKVVLCDRCVRKLMWKRNKEKEEGKSKEVEQPSEDRIRKRHRHQSDDDEDGHERSNRKRRE